MTLTIVSEEIYNVNAPFDVVGGSGWVGAAPRLTVPDDGAYGHLDPQPAFSGATYIGYEVTGDLDATDETGRADLLLDVRYRIEAADSAPLHLSVSLTGFDPDGTYVFAAVLTDSFLPPTGPSWETLTAVSVSVNPSDRAAFNACSRRFFGAEALGTWLSYDLDYLRLYGGAEPPVEEPSVVRWWPRNDGLRATSPARIGQMSSFQSGRGGGYQ